MSSTLRFVLLDLRADWRRSLLHIGAIVPIVAAYLVLIAIAGGLRGDAIALEAQNIVLLSPNALDPASGRLDPSVLDVVADVGGDDVASATPMIFRPIRVEDRVLQFRAAPQDTWQDVHGLTLLDGSWPEGGDEIAITEGIAVATEWGVGTRVEIFGTEFTITALVRAPGTKFASVWMSLDRADVLFEGQSGFQMVTVEPASGADFVDLQMRLDAASGSDFSVYFESELAAESTARVGAAENLAVVSTIIGVAALAFGGFNLAALALAERRRDVGIARSLGVSRHATAAVATIRSVILAAAGFTTGAVVAQLALAATSAVSIRSFVFEPAVPLSGWVGGVLITIGLSAAGAWLAHRAAATSSVTRLLEAL